MKSTAFRTDREIAAEEPEGEDFARLPPETWEAIRDIQWQLLDAIEDGGQAAGLAWLDARGLAYDLPPFAAVDRSSVRD